MRKGCVGGRRQLGWRQWVGWGVYFSCEGEREELKMAGDMNETKEANPSGGGQRSGRMSEKMKQRVKEEERYFVSEGGKLGIKMYKV